MNVYAFYWVEDVNSFPLNVVIELCGDDGKKIGETYCSSVGSDETPEIHARNYANKHGAIHLNYQR